MIEAVEKPEKTGRLRSRHQLVLASASPRRATILRDLGLEFEVIPSDIDEESLSELDPEMLARQLAELKADAVAGLAENRSVIAADTVVAFNGRSLGKPASTSDAVEMLRALSGQTHQVHTGVAVGWGDEIVSIVDTTAVTMRKLATAEIEEYVRSGAAMDKAGAYGIQDAEFSPVESYEGSYTNVVGLPVGALADLLLRIGEVDEATATRIRGSDK